MKYIALLFFIILSQKAAGQEKPNILFIFTDDLGYTDISPYGNPYTLTPNIQTMAEEGMIFSNAYASAPVCSPSRAGLLTGKYPARIGLTDHQGGGKKVKSASVDPPRDWVKGVPNSEYLMSEFFKDNGYHTGMIGKWHIASKTDEQPYHQGFDFSRLLVKNDYDYYNYGIEIDGSGEIFEDDGSEYLTDKLTDYGIEFIQNSKKENQPFFLYLAYSAPHVILVPRGDKVGKYLWKYERFEGKYNPYYAAMVESIDDGVGRIFHTLKQEGLLENTLIVFTSDNGGVGLPEHGYTPTNIYPLRHWKGDTFEGGGRVPAIIYWKGEIVPGSFSDYPFNNTDFFATFRNILLPHEIYYEDGLSILPILKGQLQAPIPIFWHYPHFSNQAGNPSSAVRDGDWKLRIDYNTREVFLFNLALDAGERKNLISQFADKGKSLFEMLRQHLEETKAPMPIDKATNQVIDLNTLLP